MWIGTAGITSACQRCQHAMMNAASHSGAVNKSALKNQAVDIASHNEAHLVPSSVAGVWAAGVSALGFCNKHAATGKFWKGRSRCLEVCRHGMGYRMRTSGCCKLMIARASQCRGNVTAHNVLVAMGAQGGPADGPSSQ